MIFWQEFAILFIAALLGVVAVIPYSLRLTKGKPLKISAPVIVLLSLLQNAVIFGIAIWLGLIVAHSIGLGAPYIEAMLTGASMPPISGLVIALVSGCIAGAVLLVADLCFLPYWPQKLRDTSLNTTLLENFLASFYGGIDEELLMRLFGLSVLAWLFLFVVQERLLVLWVANILMTILFGLGHLPALKSLLGTISRTMLWRSLLLNAPVGLLCGWLFWTYGIEAAIVAHFFADIVYHVIGTMVLRRRLS